MQKREKITPSRSSAAELACDFVQRVLSQPQFLGQQVQRLRLGRQMFARRRQDVDRPATTLARDAPCDEIHAFGNGLPSRDLQQPVSQRIRSRNLSWRTTQFPSSGTAPDAASCLLQTSSTGTLAGSLCAVPARSLRPRARSPPGRGASGHAGTASHRRPRSAPRPARCRSARLRRCSRASPQCRPHAAARHGSGSSATPHRASCPRSDSRWPARRPPAH